jgi:exopolyphosphatase/guanosine-5'-triphosphate,3'-diphosphate pyrophosphatase
MNIAIVDIGSNAIKYKIFDSKFNLVEYYRHPLRLGRDVFSQGYLNKNTIEEVIALLESYLKVFKEKEIAEYYFIATSALRDCKNSGELLSLLEVKNINIQIISGDTEASLLAELNKDINNSAVIDIGGGSVEICINSDNKIHTKSFQLGAVRLLNMSSDNKNDALNEFSLWLRQFSNISYLYGLGGNLRALMHVNSLDSVIDTVQFKQYVKSYHLVSEETLITEYKIPKDRIDIIPEALNLYQLIINELQSTKIENSFWSISDALVKQVVKGQL